MRPTIRHAGSIRIATSVVNAYLLMGDYQAALETAISHYSRSLALMCMGQEAEALRYLEESSAKDLPPVSRLLLVAVRALVERNKQQCVETTIRLIAQFSDPEGLYYMARMLSYCGETTQSMATLKDVVAHGFFCLPVFMRDPWLDPLRTNPEFVSILRLAEVRHQEARAQFTGAGGERLLGIRSA